MAYTEPCHKQNPGIFRTRDIFKKNSVIAYSGILRACSARILRTLYWGLLYLGLCHIQNFGLFRTLAYSESCLFRHIQAYSDIFNNNSYSNTNVLFVTLILHALPRNLIRHLFLTTITSISMLDWVYLNNTWSLKKHYSRINKTCFSRKTNLKKLSRINKVQVFLGKQILR